MYIPGLGSHTGDLNFNPNDFSQYDTALGRVGQPNFSFTPDQQDPELVSMRSRIFSQGRDNYGSRVNDLARSGLLGTSAGMGVLDQNQRNTDESLQENTGQIFAKRRAEALGLYQDERDWRKQLELARIGQYNDLQKMFIQHKYSQQDQANAQMMQTLQGLGQALPLAIGAFGGTGTPGPSYPSFRGMM